MKKVMLMSLKVIVLLCASPVISLADILPIKIDLNTLNYSDIVVINGSDKNDRSGRSICVGDINNDRFDDVVISAIWADPEGRENAGEVYIIYGGDGLSSYIDLSKYPSDVVTISGRNNNDLLGCSLSTGDVNNDGFDDVIIGAKGAANGNRVNVGEAYIIYGRRKLPEKIDLNDNLSYVVRILGDNSGDSLGNSVGTGDINRDGYDDVIVGASFSDPNGRVNAGEANIIYGRRSLPGKIDLSGNPSGVVRILGSNSGDSLGESVSAGDINRDGYDDVIIGASFGDPDGRVDAGEVYIVYGRRNLARIIDLNRDPQGVVKILGDNSVDSLGESVSVGDINRDGFDDVIIGASFGTPASRKCAGKTYIVFGMRNLPRTLDLLGKQSGLVKIFGDDTEDFLGCAVASGDINKDGFSDVIIGASSADFAGKVDSGKTYIILGKRASLPGAAEQRPEPPPEPVVRKSPANLQLVSHRFYEPSGNNALDAYEEGNIYLEISNTGKGDAHDLETYIHGLHRIPGLSTGVIKKVAKLSQDEHAIISIPVSADKNVITDKVTLVIEVKEKDGFDLDPVTIYINTNSYKPPQLVIEREIDKKTIKAQEIVHVTVYVKNVGLGTATGVKAELDIRDEDNVTLTDRGKKEFELGELKQGEQTNFVFGFFTNKRASQVLPIFVNLSEATGNFRGTSALKLVMDAPLPPLEIDVGEMIETIIDDSELKLQDIDFPPNKDIENFNGVAVVIGNRDYSRPDVQSVDFAISDAETIKEYLENTFGYKHIIYVENATATMFKSIFGTESDYKRRLHYLVKKGVTDVFVYYSGHGAPDTNTGKRYLVPVDCGRSPNDLIDGGYLIDLLFQNLAKLEPRSLVVVLEACFSGVEKASSIVIEVSDPFVKLGNAVVLSSSANDEISSWLVDKKHGLFTYFFLKAIRDKVNAPQSNESTSKNITANDIYKVVVDKDNGVPFWANKLEHGRKQTPQIFGNRNTVLLKIE